MKLKQLLCWHCWHVIPNTRRRIKHRTRCKRSNEYTTNGKIPYKVDEECCLCKKIKTKVYFKHNIQEGLKYPTEEEYENSKIPGAYYEFIMVNTWIEYYDDELKETKVDRVVRVDRDSVTVLRNYYNHHDCWLYADEKEIPKSQITGYGGKPDNNFRTTPYPGWRQET